VSTRRILLENGTDHLLLQDAVDFLLLEGTAQASDDVLIRLGPGVGTTDGSGLVAPTFTPSAGGGAVFSPFYYSMMLDWFSA
jgi:hypothetical protein